MVILLAVSVPKRTVAVAALVRIIRRLPAAAERLQVGHIPPAVTTVTRFAVSVNRKHVLQAIMLTLVRITRVRQIL